MHPTLVRKPFHRAGWVYEEKVDGWRILAYRSHHRRDATDLHGLQLRSDVLIPDSVERIVERAVKISREEPDGYEEDRARFANEAQRLSDEISRLTEAIATGAGGASLGEAVATRERQRADVLARLEHLEGLATPIAWDDDLRERLQARLTEWVACSPVSL